MHDNNNIDANILPLKDSKCRKQFSVVRYKITMR